MTSEHFASSSRFVNLIRFTMAFALFRTESDQRINVPIRTNTQRFCLVRTVRYQAKRFSSPRNPTRALQYCLSLCLTEGTIPAATPYLDGWAGNLTGLAD